ncbi:MAG TPA: FAD-dependent oxidoreductase [Rhizobiaceae bacterium]|nr:FAD-dependent oxidoreductase [Rhizobiaceae bacterium]
MGGLVIVGAGECGVRAAFALREAGFDGPVTLIGDEPHLPYERPPLSKTFPTAPKHIAGEDAYAAARIDLVRGRRVSAIDRAKKRIAFAEGGDLAYERLLIATGSRASLFPGMEKARTLRTLSDAETTLGSLAPGKKLVIVGGGFIGLELAATARKLGADVTVIEAAPRLMARVVPTEIASVAEARHRAEGVAFILGTQVRTVTETSIMLADGHVIEADQVIAGVGALPNTELAAAAGLAIENGILVDGCFRTSDPDIFAAGDCCNFPYREARTRLESWRAAQDHGKHAARAILGGEDAYQRVPWFWSDQYDLTLQVAGLPDPAAASIRRDLGDGAFILFQLAPDGSLLSASGIGVENAVAKDIRLAEMMIEKGINPEPAKLADPTVNLKSLLRG